MRFLNINIPQENMSFCQAHIGYESLQLSGISFNQLYCFGAHFTKPSGFADINARTMKNPTFLWPCNARQSTSKSGKLPGFWCRNSSLRLFIVQTSKEPSHLGHKRILLKAPCKRKYLFSRSVPTNVIFCSMAGCLRRWKWRGLNRCGGDLVR